MTLNELKSLLEKLNIPETVELYIETDDYEPVKISNITIKMGAGETRVILEQNSSFENND